MVGMASETYQFYTTVSSGMGEQDPPDLSGTWSLVQMQAIPIQENDGCTSAAVVLLWARPFAQKEVETHG